MNFRAGDVFCASPPAGLSADRHPPAGRLARPPALRRRIPHACARSPACPAGRPAGHREDTPRSDTPCPPESVNHCFRVQGHIRINRRTGRPQRGPAAAAASRGVRVRVRVCAGAGACERARSHASEDPPRSDTPALGRQHRPPPPGCTDFRRHSARRAVPAALAEAAALPFRAPRTARNGDEDGDVEVWGVVRRRKAHTPAPLPTPTQPQPPSHPATQPPTHSMRRV